MPEPEQIYGSDPTLRVGIDIGGTFTDFVLLDTTTGELFVDKYLTTAEQPARGVIEGLKQFLQKLNRMGAEIEGVIHGTTLVANTLIERKGVKTGLITTRGFRDILEIGNEIRYDLYNLQMEWPAPLAERPLRLEVSERIGPEGEIITPLVLEEAEEAARTLQAEGVESLAVVFLHSFRNPRHEEQLLEWLAQHRPELDVTLSSRISPEIREWQRTSTTVANAYVRPLVRKYLEQLDCTLREIGVNGGFHIMSSNGGMIGVSAAIERPIRLVESGPAAGVLAAAFFGELSGERQLIAFDMGGTTAKIGLVIDGKPTRSNTFEAARVQRFKRGSGLPLNVPVIDIIEIGAGGGSIARVDALGLVQVGPESAGSVPGPACYGRGGTEPTVTDADLVMGLLNPSYFLGGEMPLDVGAAEAALGKRLAELLGGNLRAAASIYQIVNNNMTSAASVHIAEKGFDPRSFTLVATGGAGPLHAYEIGRALGVKKILFPLRAGTASALGFLTAPFSTELRRSYLTRVDRVDWELARAMLAAMEEECVATVREAGAAPEDIAVHRFAQMRYFRQGYEIDVPLPSGDLTAGHAAHIAATFNEEYRRLYGRSLEVPIEFVTWRVVATAPSHEVAVRMRPAHGTRKKGTRPVYLPGLDQYVECDVYDRYALEAGDEFQGPALFEERESTAFVGVGARITVDEYLTLHVEPPK